MGPHFEAREIHAPDLVAQVLLSHVLGVEAIMLFAEPDRPATDEELARLRSLVARAAEHEPVQYLVGEAQFLGRPFHVNSSVLVPRSATEAIIQSVLDRQRGGSAGGVVPCIEHVADIGTGTGCLAVTLALHLPGSRVLATDISQEALVVARQNVERHGLEDRIEFAPGASCMPLEAAMPGEGFDLVVSNPPYISDACWETLDRNVREHEPASALRGGERGLDVIAEIIAGVGSVLAADGMFVLEFGDDQASGVLSLAKAEDLGPARIGRDAFGDERILVVDRFRS